jgi:hypothetical protein
MSQAREQSAVSLDLLSGGIVALTSATALIHLLLGLSLGPPRFTLFPLLFYLNALGYLVLLVALYIPPLARMRRVLRWVLIIYAAVTFALWFVLAPVHATEGYVDKALEGALIALLLLDDRRARLRAKKATGAR